MVWGTVRICSRVLSHWWPVGSVSVSFQFLKLMYKLPNTEVLRECSWFFTPVIRILFLFHENEASVEVHSSLPRRPQCRWLGATLGDLSPTAGHLILNSVVNGLVTEKSSPHRVRQSHFGKRADDQINSFMELSDLIKLLYYILKLINKSYQAIL